MLLFGLLWALYENARIRPLATGDAHPPLEAQWWVLCGLIIAVTVGTILRAWWQRAGLAEARQAAMLRDIMACVPGVIYEFIRRPDGTHHFAFVSEGIMDLCGISATRAMADTEGLFASIDPADQEAVFAAIDVSAETLSPWHCRFRFHRPDGQCRWLEGHSLPRRLCDGGIRWHGFIRDITETQSAHAALRDSIQREQQRAAEMAVVLDAAPIAIWIAHDGEAKHITGNRQAAAWLRLPEGCNMSASAEPPPVWGCRVVREGRDLPPEALPLQMAMDGVPVTDYECDFVYPDGQVRHVLGNAMPLSDAGGRVIGGVLVMLDISARRQAELAMQAASDAAERASHAKSRFLAAASHDLRQPLSALSIYAQMLRQEMPGGSPMLESMTGCIASLSELLNDLLDLSKLDAGVVVPSISAFPIGDLLEHLAAVHGPEAALKGLRFRCRPSLWAAETDPVLFKRILGNLVSNAIRYTAHGGVLVACRRRHGKAWVEVWDTGKGIPAGKEGEIFEEFRQLDDGARNRGSGLGLAIVARAAALLGLAVRVQSRPGRGSLFAVELPPGMLPPRTVSAPDVHPVRPLRIVLVEDNEMVCAALSQALRLAGHEVLATLSGVALRQVMGGFDPDVVVSDYRLTGGENGFDVISWVRSMRGRDVPALLVTGDTDPALLRSMAERGVAVVHKPLEFDTLQAYLDDLTWQAAAS